MLPLLTFASGVLAGVVGIRLLKSVQAPDGLRTAGTAAATGLSAAGDKARQGLDQAQAGLRQAAVAGLTTIEKSSASLRSRLGEAESSPAAEPTSDTGEQTPIRKARAKAKPPEASAEPRRRRGGRKGMPPAVTDGEGS